MKVLVRETLKTYGVNIYGTDGQAHTKDFFEKFFSDTDGIYPTLDEERAEFNTEAEWTFVSEKDFRSFADCITSVQKAIDSVQNRLRNGENADEYTFDSACYLI